MATWWELGNSNLVGGGQVGRDAHMKTLQKYTTKKPL